MWMFLLNEMVVVKQEQKIGIYIGSPATKLRTFYAMEIGTFHQSWMGHGKPSPTPTPGNSHGSNGLPYGKLK